MLILYKILSSISIFCLIFSLIYFLFKFMCKITRLNNIILFNTFYLDDIISSVTSLILIAVFISINPI